MVLLRPGYLIRMLLLKMFCREKTLTQQELDEMHKKKTLSYGWEVSQFEHYLLAFREQMTCCILTTSLTMVRFLLYFSNQYPTQLLVIVICFTYSVISPVILPIGALYFLGAFIVYKKQVLVVYSPTYESGGAMFPAACHRTLIGLSCGQVRHSTSVLRQTNAMTPHQHCASN